MKYLILCALLAVLTGCASAPPAALPPTAAPEPTTAPQPTLAPATAMPQPTAEPPTAATQATTVPSSMPTGQATTAAASCTLRLATSLGTEYGGVAHTYAYGNSGVLIYYLADFEQQSNCTVNIIADASEVPDKNMSIGEDDSGRRRTVTTSNVPPLELARQGKADLVLVHQDAEAKQFLQAGDASQSLDVMYADYVILGPKADPAKVGSAKSAQDALKQIAATQSPFISRGDNSETTARELSLWASAGISPTQATKWYTTTRQGMANTLQLANDQKAYMLIDRVSWLSAGILQTNLTLLYGGASIAQNTDKSLYIPYIVLVVNPAKHPGVNSEMATNLAKWFTSAEVEQGFGAFGLSLFAHTVFMPDAK